MNQAANGRDNHYYEELLGAAAFGTLTADEAAELRAHLATSEAARTELAELRILAGDLALLADEREPAADLRDRIEQAVRADATASAIAPPTETRDEPEPMQPLDFTAAQTRPRPLQFPAWRQSLWSAAAALVIAVLAGVLVGRIFFTQTNEPANDLQTIAYEMTLATPAPNLSAELTYDPDQGLFVLQTENMPAPPEGQVYQIWLIDKSGVPQPMGTMTEPTFAVAANKANYNAFAITTEPAPLGSTGPTTQPFFVAPFTAPAGGQ